LRHDLIKHGRRELLLALRVAESRHKWAVARLEKARESLRTARDQAFAAAELTDATLISPDADPDFAGGSYVVVQKYLHDLPRWNALSSEEQQAIIGRTKVDNVELDDDPARPAHKTLTTIEDDDGTERDILRDNMPFGRPGAGEFGTYFIGYTGRLWVLERMLEHMFIGDPPGTYDRLLDFSTAITGTTFFVPTNDMLGRLAQAPDEAAESSSGGSLGIGSLK